MSVKSEIERIKNNVTAAYTALSGKGAAMPDRKVSANLAHTINSIPNAAQAAPSISVSAAGLITASVSQDAGYIAAGTKSTTKQLATQAARTITPGTEEKTAVAAGRYTTGAVRVAGDENLLPENIKKGVTIFGVTGACEERRILIVMTDRADDIGFKFIEVNGVNVLYNTRKDTQDYDSTSNSYFVFFIPRPGEYKIYMSSNHDTFSEYVTFAADDTTIEIQLGGE